ncbi:hypothetical protein BDZ89DRAFT_1136687 [Hymenopellis radicata]|nr:hypothetical protein BDZ89DRAFT_1136687 [Hymenopellis radicata]
MASETCPCKKDAHWIVEAPLGLWGSGNGKTLFVILKWAGFCPCFSSPTPVSEWKAWSTASAAIQEQLRETHGKTLKDVRQEKNTTFLFTEEFIKDWRETFWNTHSELDAAEANHYCAGACGCPQEATSNGYPDFRQLNTEFFRIPERIWRDFCDHSHQDDLLQWTG